MITTRHGLKQDVRKDRLDYSMPGTQDKYQLDRNLMLGSFS